MSNSGKVWDVKEAYKQIRANTWSAGDRGLFMGGSAPSASSVISPPASIVKSPASEMVEAFKVISSTVSVVNVPTLVNEELTTVEPKVV